jgi:DNA-binding PadR family transcriptional regulator
VSAGDLEPTEQELRTYGRLLLHIATQPRSAAGETAPESLTQAGMVKVLGASQAVVSYALKNLVDGGALSVERSHVPGRSRRVKVYQLTAVGEGLVRHIRSSVGL